MLTHGGHDTDESLTRFSKRNLSTCIALDTLVVQPATIPAGFSTYISNMSLLGREAEFNNLWLQVPSPSAAETLQSLQPTTPHQPAPDCPWSDRIVHCLK
jgi:hypothetical protein